MARSCGQSGPWLDPAALRQWQLAALRAACRNAAGARFYRALFAGLPQGDLPAGRWPRDYDDFATAPFTRPGDLHGRWRDFLRAGLGDIARMVSLETSGTTYAPKRIAFGGDDLERIVAYFAAGIAGMVEPGDTVLILLPGADRPAGVSQLLIRALERLDARGVAGTPRVAADVFRDELVRHRPAGLVAAPSQLQALFAVDSLRKPLRETIRAVLSCTSPLAPDLKTLLEREWEAGVYEYYGTTESGYGGGVECFAHNGYHLNEVDLFFEVVDPVDGSPLPEGRPGEVVFTTLNRAVMPLVRYRTGDYAAILPGPCGCGSRMRRLGMIRGRIRRSGGGVEIVELEKGAYHARHLGRNL